MKTTFFTEYSKKKISFTKTVEAKQLPFACGAKTRTQLSAEITWIVFSKTSTVSDVLRLKQW